MTVAKNKIDCSFASSVGRSEESVRYPERSVRQSLMILLALCVCVSV